MDILRLCTGWFDYNGGPVCEYFVYMVEIL